MDVGLGSWVHNGTTAVAGSMVRDRLSRFCTGVWNRVEQHRPLSIGVAAAGTLALGLTSWSLMEQGKLSSVGMERGRQREDNPSASVPLPPKSRSWRSPLARQCSGVDRALRSRLNQLDARSGSWRTFVKIDPTNFGERYDKDAYGRLIDATPRVVVLHETVYSLSSALNTFMTPHPRDEDQVDGGVEERRRTRC